MHQDSRFAAIGPLLVALLVVVTCGVPAETGDGATGGDQARVESARAEAALDSILADVRMPIELKVALLSELLDEYGELEVESGGGGPGHEDWVYRAADALGRLYVGTGAGDRAVFYLEVAVEGMADDADLHNTLGYLYAEQGINLDRSEELIRRALEIAPDDTPERIRGYYRDSLGWALFKQGRFEAALVELEAADRMAPGTMEIREHLIAAYEELGRVEDATRILADDLVAARGVNPELRARLRRLNRTTPEGAPLPVEVEIERRVLERELAELEAIDAAGGSIIRLTASDGFPLTATFYPSDKGQESPAVLLVPMFGGERSDYDRLARELAGAGISALSLDLRAHGASVTRELYDPTVFRGDMPSFFRGALLDISEGIRFLRRSDARNGRKVALVGASLGGYLGALAGASGESIDALVLLSPGTAEPFRESVISERERPTLIVASADDAIAVAGAEDMIAELDRTRSRLVVYPGASHGTDLLVEVGDLTPLVVRWLRGAFGDARDL
jgi:dienelactone hydrolase